MNEQTTELATTSANGKKDVKALINSDHFRHAVAASLPSHLKPDRFIRVALTALTRTPKLMQCEQESFFQCLLTLSQLGLEPDGRNAHLIPFENRKRGVTECQLIVDYKGLVDLAMRSGKVGYIHADKICQNDVFVYDRGEIKKHEVNFKVPRGEAYAYYALVRFKDGSEKPEVMPKEDIDKIRARSRAKDSGPWVTDYDEMAKKGLALDTPIPTPKGWTTMGDIKAGDLVFDMYGQPVNVLAVSEIKKLQCFKVNFTNGDSIVCDDEHRWIARGGGSNACREKFKVCTVNELYDAKIDGLSVTIPVQKALRLPHANLLIEPYLLGYWLGDGACRTPAITCSEQDLDHVCQTVRSSKYVLGKLRRDSRSAAYCVRIKRGMLSDLRDLNLICNKHIPAVYLRASVEQRIALLSGLMDSDGHLDKERGRAHFYNKNKAIASGVAELVASLGDVPHTGVRQMKGFGISGTTNFIGWKPSVCPVRLTRKVANFRPRRIEPYRAVGSVDMVPSVATRCIAVDGTTQSYLAGVSMAVTHNTVFRRLTKWLQLSPEFRDALEKDADTLEEHRFDAALPAQATAIERPIIAKPKGRPKKEKVKLEKKPEQSPFEADLISPTPEMVVTNSTLIQDKLAKSGHTVTQLLKVAIENEWIEPDKETLEEIGDEKLGQFLEFWDVVAEQLPK